MNKSFSQITIFILCVGTIFPTYTGFFDPFRNAYNSAFTWVREYPRAFAAATVAGIGGIFAYRFAAYNYKNNYVPTDAITDMNRVSQDHLTEVVNGNLAKCAEMCRNSDRKGKGTGRAVSFNAIESNLLPRYSGLLKRVERYNWLAANNNALENTHKSLQIAGDAVLAKFYDLPAETETPRPVHNRQCIIL